LYKITENVTLKSIFLEKIFFIENDFLGKLFFPTKYYPRLIDWMEGVQ